MFTCPNCNRTGKIYGPPDTIAAQTHWKTCPSCVGKGVIPEYNRRKCPECEGWGEVGMVLMNPEPCPNCNARGIV